MTEHHHLHNTRTVRPPHTVPPDTATPQCSQCGIALHLVPLAGIHTGTRTWCSDTCYRRYIDESAAQAVRDHVATGAWYTHVASGTWHAEWHARNPPPPKISPSSSPSTWTPPKKKSVARQTAEVGANVVGFTLWLILVSFIGMIIAVLF